ncbi:DUF6578 domain-containing protein [Enterococcus sp. LJL128]|uniref:DUF6578 domain-containing protein n=1 Tax=Enterococcus sp. LJL51 TaxID=3416656 RepID=UPI003CF12F01
MKHVVIWVADWQMQCCGNPFCLNEIVNWTVVNWTNDNSTILDNFNIDYYLENHLDELEKYEEIRGEIVSIDKTYLTYQIDEKRNVYVPIDILFEGTSNKVTGYEKNKKNYDFAGYLVKLQVE